MYSPSPQRYDNMLYAPAGKSGLRLPRISLGLWHNFGEGADYENMKRMVFTAFDNGIVHFDLANNYGPPIGSAEQNFGRILREELKGHRDELFISTKAGYPAWEGPYGVWGSRKSMLTSLDQSLQRLGLPYVDVFYHHRPDPNTPMEETLEALDTAAKQGKTLYVGVSRYSGEQLHKACGIFRELHTPFLLCQNRYSLIDREVENNGLLTALDQEGKGLVVFSALAQGLLTDRYLHGIPQDSRAVTDGKHMTVSAVTAEAVERAQKLEKIAGERGESIAAMALAWVLQHKQVTSVILGASRPAQITEGLKAMNRPPFTKEQLTALDSLCLGENGK